MMFANRFFGNGWGEGNGQGAQNIEVQAQLSALRDQMNSNQNSNLLMDAIKGNNVAIGQLAGQLNCDFNTLNSAICDVITTIAVFPEMVVNYNRKTNNSCSLNPHLQNRK